jgi:hypothetical protein
MAIPTHIKTYSLTDVKVATLTGDTPGTLVDVPGIRSLTVTLTTEEIELRGDNSVIAVADQGRGLEWSAEAGGLSMAAYQVITGKSFSDTGSTPNAIRAMHINSTDSSPYFYLAGTAPGDDATSELQVHIYRAKASGNIELNFSDGEFLTPGFSGRAVGRVADNRLLTIRVMETAAALAVVT